MAHECGSCTMCCKLLGIAELEKQPGQWCPHCAIGKGCKIYPERPKVCRDFECLWLQHPELDEELRPDKTRVILWEPEDSGGRLVANVDPARWETFNTGEVKKLLDYLVHEGLVIGVSCGDRRQILAKDPEKVSEDFKIMMEVTK